MTLTANGYNENGVAMCECGNKRAHAWEPGEWCGDRVIPAAAGWVDCGRCGKPGCDPTLERHPGEGVICDECRDGEA